MVSLASLEECRRFAGALWLILRQSKTDMTQQALRPNPCSLTGRFTS